MQLERLSLCKADGLYGPSRFLADVVGKALDRPVRVIEPPFEVFHNSVDESLRRELLEGRKYLLFFGSIGLLKGAGLNRRVIGELLEKHRDLYFVFVGKDKGLRGEPMMEHIRKKAGPAGPRSLPRPIGTRKALACSSVAPTRSFFRRGSTTFPTPASRRWPSVKSSLEAAGGASRS